MEKQSKGYQLIVERLQRHWQETKSFQRHQLEQWIDTTEKYLHAAGELSKDEIELLSQQVKDDLGELAKEFSASKGSFRDSVFYLALKETLWHWLADVADQSKVKWEELELIVGEQSRSPQAGHVSGVARLECSHCGAQLRLLRPQKIPVCNQCGEAKYHRKELQ